MTSRASTSCTSNSVNVFLKTEYENIKYENLIKENNELLLDHLVDHIEQSNRQVEYLNLLQQHRYIKECQIRHLKIEKMFVSSSLAFVYPIKRTHKNILLVK